MADTEFVYHLERSIKVAADGDDPGTMHQRLGNLAEGDLSCGQEDDTGDSTLCCVGGEACGGVPGACAGDTRHPEFKRHADTHGHAAVLERAGRVHTLVLGVELAETQFFAYLC